MHSGLQLFMTVWRIAYSVAFFPVFMGQQVKFLELSALKSHNYSRRKVFSSLKYVDALQNLKCEICSSGLRTILFFFSVAVNTSAEDFQQIE